MSGGLLFSVDTVSLGGPEVGISIRAVGEDGSEVHLSDYRFAPDAPQPRPARPSEKVVCVAEITYNRGKWPDLLHVGGMNDRFVVVARQVADILASIGVQSFRSFSVQPAPRKPGSGLPRGKQMPEYVALLPATGVELERQEFHSTPRRRRQLDFTPSNRELKRWVPREGTWKGYDLFRGGRVCCCTRRIIELAHQHRWTNFEFKPLDVRRDMPTSGIDYLSAQWPPESWYPPSPGEGRTVEQWVEAYMEQVRSPQGDAGSRLPAKRMASEVRQRPQNAIVCDLAAEAVPLFVDIARTGDDRDQRIAARMLLTLARHTRIDTSILKSIVLPVFERSLRQGETIFGHTAIVLDSFIEVPKDVLELAHKATGKPPMIMPYVYVEEDRKML